MQAFSVPRTIAYATRHGWRRIEAAAAADGQGGIDPARLILVIHDEDGVAQRTLEALPPDQASGSSESDEGGLRFYAEEQLAPWPGFPTRLGRSSDPAAADVSAPLHGQLATLRERHSARRHFRIALVGGFGFSFGDMLIGATAWRIVLPVLRAVLGSVSASVLMGPQAHPATAELIGHAEGIDEVRFLSPSLQDFSRYDAFFDFTGLVTLPRFHEGAALDWILWWLGLAPDEVPASTKRNHLHLPSSAVAWARERLAKRPGPRVMFVWRASTPLRSIPDEVALRLAVELLDAAPEITLVTERALDLAHPRLLDLGAETDTAARMMALVAECDGLLTVDSLAPHVADAADVPTLMLLNSYPTTRFPFYPGMRSIVPAGMEALPGWGSTKVADEAWEGMREGYARAWAGVSGHDCWAALSDLVAARVAPRLRIGVDAGMPLDSGRTILPAAGQPFPRDFMAPLDLWVERECSRMASQVLERGKVAVLAGGWDGGLALALGKRVAPGGTVHVLEPRRLRAQKLAADAQGTGLGTLRIWPAAAGAWPGSRVLADFDPLGEAYPGSWGNLDAGVEAAVLALDELPAPECHVLVIGAPQEVPPALTGAVGLLRRTGTLLVAAPVRAVEAADLRQILDGAGYRGFLCWADPGRSEVGLLVAIPALSDIRFEGFDEL